MSIHLHLNTLPKEQQKIWAAFSQADMSGFMLYGGTALALHYGHRISVDFDFFGSSAVTAESIARRIPWLTENLDDVLQEEKNTYTVQVTSPETKSGNSVKLSFFGSIDFPTLDAPTVASNGIEVASVRDILSTKLKAIHGRVEAKDYIDIAEILGHSNDPVLRLQDGLADYTTVFPNGNPSIPLKALCWFADGDLSAVNQSTRNFLQETVREVTNIPKAKPVFRTRIGIDMSDINI